MQCNSLGLPYSHLSEIYIFYTHRASPWSGYFYWLERNPHIPQENGTALTCYPVSAWELFIRKYAVSHENRYYNRPLQAETTINIPQYAHPALSKCLLDTPTRQKVKILSAGVQTLETECGTSLSNDGAETDRNGGLGVTAADRHNMSG